MNPTLIKSLNYAYEGLPLPAENLLWNLEGTDKADLNFRQRVLKKMPYGFRLPLAKDHKRIYLTHGKRHANLEFLRIEKLIDKMPENINTVLYEVKTLAKRLAEDCTDIFMRGRNKNLTPQQIYESMTALASSRGITPPKLGSKHNEIGVLMRLMDSKWWRRAIRTTYGRKMETLARDIGLVCKRRQIYISDDMNHHLNNQRSQNLKLLEELQAINEEGDSFTLRELSDKSISNPVIRRHELMTRLRGFEDCAKECGHIGLFITITCPSRMHARYKSGDITPKYDGTTPREAQNYLSKVWSRIRAKLNRDGVDIYGMRVCEPHHDGTPHWHILLFVVPEHKQKVIDVTKYYSLQTDGNEKGAKERRCIIKDIDWSKGSATGYIAKYISKSIDGFGIDEDLYGKNAKSSATRIVNWSRVAGIRQFQQFGGAPVTVWRELRRLHTSPQGSFGEIHKAADEGDWFTYTQLMGGATSSRKDLLVSLHTEYIEDENQYGEPMGNKILGVQFGDQIFTTRFHTWTISHTPLIKTQSSGAPEEPLGAGAISPEGSSSFPPRDLIESPEGINENNSIDSCRNPAGPPQDFESNNKYCPAGHPAGLNSEIGPDYNSSGLNDLKNPDDFDHLEFCQ